MQDLTKTLFAFALLSSAHLSFALQSDTLTILPGSRILQVERFNSYFAPYTFYKEENGVKKRIGSMKDAFQIDKQKGIALRVCQIQFDQNTIIDSGMCLIDGFSPIYHRSIQTKKSMDVRFEGKLVKGKVVQESHVDNVNFESTVPLFDSFYEDILARALPLTDGLVFRFPEYIYERGGEVWSVGEVNQLINEGSSNVWAIKFYEKDNSGKTRRITTYHIDSDDRKILFREYLMGNSKIIMEFN